MPRTMRIRNASCPLRALSLVTLMALLVAPACAPLCAAQACMQASGSAGMESHCHFRGIAHGGEAHLHSVQGCGAPELQLANLTSANRRESLQRDRATVSAHGVGVVSAEHSSPLAHHRGACRIGEEPPSYSCSSPARAVLRI